MIDQLKLLIDECEDKPRLKEILLKVAGLSESKQEYMLTLMKLI